MGIKILTYNISDVEKEELCAFDFTDMRSEIVLAAIDSAKGYDISARQIAAQTGFPFRGVIQLCYWLVAKGDAERGVDYGYRSVYYDRVAGEYYSNELLECAREVFTPLQPLAKISTAC